jgi:putative transcriptional regulator
MAKGEGPSRAIVTLGYAGWEAGQLEQEVMDNAWLTTRADERIIFDTPLDERWTAATRKLGVTDPSQIAGYAGHA